MDDEGEVKEIQEVPKVYSRAYDGVLGQPDFFFQKFECQECGEVFASRNKLFKHVRSSGHDNSK